MTDQITRAQRWEARMTRMEEIISACRGEYIATNDKIDKLREDITELAMTVNRIDERLLNGRPNFDRHEQSINDLYQKRDGDHRSIIGALVAGIVGVVMAIVGFVSNLLLKG